jgi:ribonuclease HII
MREAILKTPGVLYGIAGRSAAEIDRTDILRRTWEAMREALSKLSACDFILVDGRKVPNLPAPSLAIVKGDAKSASVAAASILAKTHRDALMERMALEYPGYGFEAHKGYGTAEHVEAIKRLGPCPEHRKSFEPLKTMLSPMTQGELLF